MNLAATNVYAAGACLYELATGKRQHGGKHGALLTEAIPHEAVVSPRSVKPALSVGFESVVLKCLDKEPGFGTRRRRNCSSTSRGCKRRERRAR